MKSTVKLPDGYRITYQHSAYYLDTPSGGLVGRFETQADAIAAAHAHLQVVGR